MLIVNPPPAENALPGAEVESLISGAVAAAEAAGIRGKAVTPFLLEQLARNSGGKTLQTNIALLVANARSRGHCGGLQRSKSRLLITSWRSLRTTWATQVRSRRRLLL
jgi:pseudouridine-5'-phosphate glycosidase